MNNELKSLLIKIGEDYRDEILAAGRHYLELDLHKEAEQKGVTLSKEAIRHGCAVIPLKEPGQGMKVRIDGRAWVGYAQFESGVVVPGYIAKMTGLPYKQYEPQDSMIKNFSKN